MIIMKEEEMGLKNLNQGEESILRYQEDLLQTLLLPIKKLYHPWKTQIGLK